MATTINLYATKSGYVSEESASTVFPTDPSTEYSVGAESGHQGRLYLGFESFPDEIKHNVLQIVRLRLQTMANGLRYTPVYINAYPCDDFEPETLTYRNQPVSFTAYKLYCYGTSPLFYDMWLAASSSDQANRVAGYFATHAGVQIRGGTNATASKAQVKTALSDGTQPYLEVTYDESTKISSQVMFRTELPKQIRSSEACRFSWYFKKVESSWFAASEEWDQLSAVFKWRVKDASSWNEIPITGNVKELTIPANTFSPGSTIEYRLEATDEDNNTSYLSGTRTILTSQITPSSSPTSGYVNPRNSVTFSWNYEDALGTVEAGASTLHWRVSGSENWTNVLAASGATSLTIQANTFQTASTIEWYLSGTDASGYASQTSVYSFSTAASAVKATAISPSNTIESNNAPITFRWSYSSNDGFQPSRYQFKWKLATDTEYTTLLDETDVVTEYTFPAYTFPAGEIRWGVLPYNIDGVSGTGSTQTFISYGAPEAPVVYADAKPFTTVSWQANDQQAYQIKVDDTFYGPYFGTEKSFAIPDKLEDGTHKIGVAVIGTYALWSEWGESIITVQNVPGAAFSLDAEAQIDVELMFSTAEENPTFLIYRDDVLIGKTQQNTFTDRFATGEHTYKAINRLSDGNYSESNTVTLETYADGIYIALLSGGEWLKIKYSRNDKRDPTYEQASEDFRNHMAGDVFPSAVLSGYREDSAAFSALFLYNQETERKRFEAMLGKPVIIKFRDGTVFPTIMDKWTKTVKKQYWIDYSFTLRRIELEDYVDDTT